MPTGIAVPAPQPAKLLAWYDRHRRDLPWRAAQGAHPDPYAVWLSEVMLQQTTVEAVKAYYTRFLARWPTVDDLARAPLDAVMQAWAGLGYYSRARNLHACAQMVAESREGRFPDVEDELRRLPGIGAYTAAAVAAIAFDRRAVVVDANVERVVARLYAIEEPLPRARAAIREAAGRLTPQARCGDFAQAMMDLGSMICTPKRPACALCPFEGACVARQRGVEALLPRRAAKAEKPQRTGAVFVISRPDGAVLVRTRPPKGLLGGMTEFPGTPWSVGVDPDASAAVPPLPVRLRRLAGQVEHGFTHFCLTLTVFVGAVARPVPPPAEHRWVAAADLAGEALPTLMRKVQRHAEAARWRVLGEDAAAAFRFD